ncbi:cytochrome c family protein [Magnetospira thiophila]
MKLTHTLTLGLAAFATVLAVGSANAADLKNGKKVFKKCKACHEVKQGKNKVGPSLYGVVGRASASIDDFKYSDAMKAAGKTWDEATIAEYLKDPKAFVPGNKMAFPGLKKDDDIADVIAYIEEESK